MNTRNVTLALPEELLRRVKVIAAERDTSLSAMLTRSLEQIADQDSGYAEARAGMLRDLKKGYKLGTKGAIRWNRDSLHER